MGLVLLLLPPLCLLGFGLRRQFKFDHYFCFALGFCYYVCAPLLLSAYSNGYSDELMQIWWKISKVASMDNVAYTAVFSMAIFVSFYGGCMMARLLGARRPRQEGAHGVQHPLKNQTVLTSPIISQLFLAILIAFFLVLVWMGQGFWFSGYTGEYDTGLRGPLQGIILAFAVMFLLMKTSQNFLAHDLRWSGLKMTAATFTVAAAILSLSVGSRQNFVLSVISIAVYYSCFIYPFKRWKVIVFGVACITLISIVGAARIGGNVFSFMTVGIFYESVLTSISLFSGFQFNDFPLFSYPAEIIEGSANLIPSFLWDKTEFLASIASSNFVYASPLGAKNGILSLAVNFGLLGGCIAVFALGALLEFLSSKNRHPILYVTYSIATAGLAMDIWRNPFQVSIIKNMLQMGVLFVLVYAASSAILEGRCRQTREAGSRVPKRPLGQGVENVTNVERD